MVVVMVDDVLEVDGIFRDQLPTRRLSIPLLSMTSMTLAIHVYCSNVGHPRLPHPHTIEGWTTGRVPIDQRVVPRFHLPHFGYGHYGRTPSTHPAVVDLVGLVVE